MELYNVEKKPLRKKDSEAYYYDDTGKFSRVPSMFDSREKVFAFVMTCAKKSIPGVTTALIEETWEEAEKKKGIILDALDQLKREHESAADYIKASAYGKAIPQIKKLQVPLLSGAQAQKLKGIGKGIASHIDEILRVGKLKSVEEREQSRIERQKVIELFTKIWGVTTKIAGEWYSQGFSRVADVPKDMMSEQQRIGIKYYDEISRPIPREEVSAITDAIVDEIKPGESAYGITNIDAVGAYRRAASEVEVVEILISIDEEKTKINKPLLRKIVNILEEAGIITDAPVFGPKKFMGIALAPKRVVHSRIDISLIPSSTRGAVLIHATGPQAFVVNVKENAAFEDTADVFLAVLSSSFSRYFFERFFILLRKFQNVEAGLSTTDPSSSSYTLNFRSSRSNSSNVTTFLPPG